MISVQAYGYAGSAPALAVGSMAQSAVWDICSVGASSKSTTKSTTWLSCVAYGKRAEIAMKLVREGEYMFLLGYMKADKEDKTKLRLVVNSIQILGNKEAKGYAEEDEIL